MKWIRNAVNTNIDIYFAEVTWESLDPLPRYPFDMVRNAITDLEMIIFTYHYCADLMQRD